jgi:hypothetical protein
VQKLPVEEQGSISLTNRLATVLLPNTTSLSMSSRVSGWLWVDIAANAPFCLTTQELSSLLQNADDGCVKIVRQDTFRLEHNLQSQKEHKLNVLGSSDTAVTASPVNWRCHHLETSQRYVNKES